MPTVHSEPVPEHFNKWSVTQQSELVNRMRFGGPVDFSFFNPEHESALLLSSMSNPDKITAEILKMLAARDQGAKLNRIEDCWQLEPAKMQLGHQEACDGIPGG